MKDANKRIDRMIADLENWREKLTELEMLQFANTLITLDSSHSDYAELKQRIQHLDNAYKKAAKDLKKTFSMIRGYKLEADITTKQARKWRALVPDSEKMGDVASVDLTSGKTKVYQAKSTSAHSNSEVNTHLRKAFIQLFGVKGEIPAPAAQLTIVIEIQSKKNLWPFLEKHYGPKKNVVTKSAFDKYASKTICDAAKFALSQAKDLIEGANKRDSDGKLVNEKAFRMNSFVLAIERAKISVKVKFKKPAQIKIGGSYVQVNRTKETDISQFTAVLKAGRDGTITKVSSQFS